MMRFAGYYDDQLVKSGGKWLLRQRIIRLWDGEVLARFPGRGKRTPRKRPPELVIGRPYSRFVMQQPRIVRLPRERRINEDNRDALAAVLAVLICITVVAQTPKPVRTQAGLVQGASKTASPFTKAFRSPRRRWAICAGARRSRPRVEGRRMPPNSRRPACRFPS